MGKNKKSKKIKSFSSQSKFDTQGSYTGVDNDDRFALPIQDADDL